MLVISDRTGSFATSTLGCLLYKQPVHPWLPTKHPMLYTQTTHHPWFSKPSHHLTSLIRAWIANPQTHNHHLTLASSTVRNSLIFSRVTTFLTQLKVCHSNILEMQSRSLALSKCPRSSSSPFSRQTSFSMMQQTRTTIFSIWGCWRCPWSHSSMPFSTICLTLAAVATSLFLTMQMQVVLSSSVSLFILSYSLALLCSVAKAWSMLPIQMKASSFFYFIFLSSFSLFFITFFRFTNPHTPNTLLYPIRFTSPRNAAILAIIFSTSPPKTVSSDKYAKASALRLATTSCITSAMAIFWFCRCSTLSRKISLPRWNQKSSIFLCSAAERQCGSISIFQNKSILRRRMFSLCQRQEDTLRSETRKLQASAQSSQVSSASGWSGGELEGWVGGSRVTFYLAFYTILVISSKGLIDLRQFIDNIICTPDIHPTLAERRL